MARPHENVTVSRPMVGVIAIACLLAWGGLWFVPRDSTSESDESKVRMWQAGFGRVGLVMSALWIALPSRKRPAAWANISIPMLVAFVATAIAIGRYPRVGFIILIVLVLASLFLRPRGKQRPSSRA